MKDSKAVNVTKREIRSVFNREYGIYSNTLERFDRDFFTSNYTRGSDFSCQFNSRRDRGQICTCRRSKYKRNRYYISSQVYRAQNKYLYSSGLADIGVGSVKALAKRRVKRIYLPEAVDAGVGSSELISSQPKRKNWETGYYDNKKTSSKCVGGFIINIDVAAIDKTLSPIIQTKSESTSPEVIVKEQKNINFDSNIFEKLDSEVEIDFNDKTNSESIKQDTIVIVKQYLGSPSNKISKKLNTEVLDPRTHKKSINTTVVDNEKKNLSSDSLVQHISNLEISSFEKSSRVSLDPMENKLEREFRKIFSTKQKPKQTSDEKPIPDFNSASLLRRRFEALRQGLGRKRDSKKDSIVIKTSSQSSVPSRKDVSIVSDPPSLEARSFSKTKLYSPKTSLVELLRNTIHSDSYNKAAARNEAIIKLSSEIVDNEYQGVKGMFKLWGKKFNLDENENAKVAPPTEKPGKVSKSTDKNENPLLKEEPEKSKKEGRLLSFFKKKQKIKDKDKLKNPYKSRKGVTAGRCEVRDGLMIKIGLEKENPLQNSAASMKNDGSKHYDNILREAWLKRFLTSKIDLKKSADIRWNNKMYTTSSSTVFELLDCVYKNNGIVMRSKSDMDTEDSSMYYSFQKENVNFMKQHIKAFMLPKTIIDLQNAKHPQITKSISNEQSKNIEVTFSNRKWFIDKSKAFSKNVEIVLHSNNYDRTNNKKSSEYITINIPERYFSDSATDNSNHSSDEEVYKIVEYETPNSNSVLRKKREQNMDTGDHNPTSNDIKVIVSIKDSGNVESKVLETIIKRPPLHRDVVVQGSKVYIPTRCDVIGVGIITQKDIRDIKKPILKIQDYLSDEDSEPLLPPQKKCELAESYLQDYYRHWTPLGIDLYSSCVSESQLKGSSENNSLNSLNNQGDGSKSCPNICDDYQASTIVSSCDTSSCSHCRAVIVDEDKKQDDKKISKYLHKFKKKPYEANDGKRVLPKDSLEVVKKRKMYAASNKSNWSSNQQIKDNPCEPHLNPSWDEKCSQDTCDLSQLNIKPCSKHTVPKKRYSKKRVCLQDCNAVDDMLVEQVSDKGLEGILTFKKAAGCSLCKAKLNCPKHARVIPTPVCQIPQPPCKDSCLSKKKPACSKKSSPSCNVSTPPHCPAGPPSPCQKICPPKLPPCQAMPDCMLGPNQCDYPPPCPEKANTSCARDSMSSINRPRRSSSQTYVPDHSNKSTPCPTPPRQSSSKRYGSPDCVIPMCTRPGLKSPARTPPPCKCSPSRASVSSCTNTRKMSRSSLAKRSSCSTSTDSCMNSEQTSCTSVPKKPTQPTQSKLSSCTSPQKPLLKSPQCPGNCQSPREIPKKSSCPTVDVGTDDMLCRNESGVGLIKKLDLCRRSNSLTNAIKRFIDKVSSNFSVKGKSKSVSCGSPIINDTEPPCKPTGIHLRKLPSQKRSDSSGCNTNNLIRLNSKEEIHIKMLNGSPSTDEIRESCNIKVQDEDGRTLYERRDYTTNKPYIVRDLYRDSQVNRVSTPNVTNELVSEKKSSENKIKCNNSVCAIVEINLTLKFKQMNKNTQIGINNYGDNSAGDEPTNKHTDSPKEVYLIQDSKQQNYKESGTKDLNIKVTIKNYKQADSLILNDNLPARLDNDEFSKKISNKFITVSTGYSEKLLNQQAYSLHTTNNSKEKLNIEHIFNSNSVHMMNLEHDVIPDLPMIQINDNNLSLEREVTKLSKSIDNFKDQTSFNNIKTKEDEKSIPINTASYTKESINIDINKGNEEITDTVEKSKNEEITDTVEESDKNIIKKPRDKKFPVSILKLHNNKEEKKEMLKYIFESESKLKGHHKKEKVKKLRQMLHAILTSDSSDDINISNQLADEVTYASLKPNYFRDTDSMNNYCPVDSSASEKESKTTDTEDQIYPTEDDDNNTSETSHSNVNDNVGCLCSQVAAKLNVNLNGATGCCCGIKEKKNEETYCDLRDEYFLNYNNKFVNVETQDSRFGKYKSVIMTNMSTTVTIEGIMSDDNKKHSKSEHRCGHHKRRHRTLDKVGLGTPTDKVLVPRSNELINHQKMKRNKNFKPEDILQLNETKKAVLKIYTEKTISDRGQHIVARLPKFVVNRESEVRNYEEVIAGFKHISQRNTTSFLIKR